MTTLLAVGVGILIGCSPIGNTRITEISINKLLKKILKLIDPVISDQRFWRTLGHKNPNKMPMYEQRKDMGSSIVGQKYKHCNLDKLELPSSPNNVKHIIND